MTVRKSQIIARALKQLGVLGAGQPVHAEDSDNVDLILRNTIALMSANDVISLQSEYDTDAFPDEIYLPLSTIVAFRAAPDYGFGGADLAGAKANADLAEEEIRAMFMLGRGVQPTVGSYF